MDDLEGKHYSRRALPPPHRTLPEDEGGGYLIEFANLPGCMSDGATIEEAITNGVGAMHGWIEAMRAEGHPIHAPTRSAAA